MRKRIIVPSAETLSSEEWLDLEKVAQVEITSETPANPIDSALVPGVDLGWAAAQSGEQTLRLLFDEPIGVKRIRLVFKESNYRRTQEFVLRWSNDGVTFKDIVRQQYNFNPPGTEVEEYDIDLGGVTALELNIVPDISGGPAIASLAELRIA
jgi:hypothetical protein